MSPEDPRHGETAGYDAHRRAGQNACDACLRAVARYQSTLILERGRGHRRTVSAVGTSRRIQALVALGYTFGQIAEPLGVSHDMPRKWAYRQGIVHRRVADRVDRLFLRLCMTPAPTTTVRQRRSVSYAQTVARKHNWAPPLAWDDIDDPREQPKRAQFKPRVQHTSTHLLGEWDHLRGLGVGIEQAARQLGVTVEAIELAIRKRERSAT